MSQEIITQIESSLKNAKQALESDDADKIKSAHDQLEKDSLAMGNYMYQ